MMENNTELFLHEMIEKLSLLNEEEMSRSGFLEDICRYFDISHAFIYENSLDGIFIKREYFEITKINPFPDRLDLKKQLGAKFLSELCGEKVIIHSCDEENNPLNIKLCEILKVNTIIFIPILNQHYELAGFVGLADRRKKARHAKATINNACALLNLLANTVKLEMFQRGIATTREVLGNVLDHIGIDVYVNDYYTHDVLYANKSMAEPYGGVDNMVGGKCWKTIFTDKDGPCDFCPQPKLMDEDGNLNKTYQWDYERPFDKSWFRVLSSSFPWLDGRIAHLVASVDITESKRNQLLIEKLALYDHLTGLNNRRSLHDDIQHFIEDKNIFGESWYLMFCDLDGFKTVNDTLGHDAGDVLLKGISKDLLEIQSDDIRAYRQGGDEFVVIMRNDNLDKLKEVIDRLFALFRKRYKYNGQDMGCGCSIGVAHYPSDANTAKDIFHLADTAMYRVKKEGRGTVRFYYKGEYLTMDDYFNMSK